MSRHRDVRSMNYSDEYEGYDDIYGHSVEEDYCVSPGAEQFMFDRNKQADISSFLTEPKIAEDSEEEFEEKPESSKSPALSELESAKLMSCIETIKNVVGDTISESDYTKKIIELDYNAEAVLDSILCSASAKKSTGLSLGKMAFGSKPTPSAFTIPKLTFKKRPDFDRDEDRTNFSISPLSSFKSLNFANTKKESTSLSAMISSHKELNFSLSGLKSSNLDSKLPKSSSLADLISNHKKLHLPKSTDSPSFSSLSNLTSHHLKKSLPEEGLKKSSSSQEKATEFPKTLFNLKNTFASLHLQQKDDKAVEKSVKDDEWEVDLSCALKTVDLARPRSLKVEKSESINCENYSTESTLNRSNFDTLCFFNLRSLEKAELQYSLKKASPLGRVLCNKWKAKKPQARKKAWYFQTDPKVKRFDFSDPSPDSKNLQYLRKKI